MVDINLEYDKKTLKSCIELRENRCLLIHKHKEKLGSS